MDSDVIVQQMGVGGACSSEVSQSPEDAVREGSFIIAMIIQWVKVQRPRKGINLS